MSGNHKVGSKRVFIEHRAEVTYPSGEYRYAPSVKYPEYDWDDISPIKNNVYDMVRCCLAGYGLDKEHYGTSEWNPLRDVIHKGDVVVLKPNWVEDKNENKAEGIDCLVTNASILRAMIDYVYLALQGTGKIIIGDSPMPDCDFDSLMKKADYESVWKSCEDRNISIEVMDFREDITTGFANEVKRTSGEQEIIVDLGIYSFFAETEYNAGRYRNGIVDATKMNQFYHGNGHHRYGINKTILSADVIINLPKPKTHRKAGFTAALKNYIGVCSRKISIPHNVTGNTNQGGDTYFGPRVIFGTEGMIRDCETRALSNGKVWKGRLLKCLRIPFWTFRRLTHKRFFGTGNWYKNDTIWRSILDINRIMVYTDKKGVLQDFPQRKFFSLGDMVISGHKNGPLAPAAKPLGVVLCTENPVVFDMAVIKIMGFRYDLLPVLNKIPLIKTYPIDECDYGNMYVGSNDGILDGKSVLEMPSAPYGGFTPAEGWEPIGYA